MNRKKKTGKNNPQSSGIAQNVSSQMGSHMAFVNFTRSLEAGGQSVHAKAQQQLNAQNGKSALEGDPMHLQRDARNPGQVPATNHQVSEYFNALPSFLQENIMQSGTKFDNVEDLKRVADQMMKRNPNQ